MLWAHAQLCMAQWQGPDSPKSLVLVCRDKLGHGQKFSEIPGHFVKETLCPRGEASSALRVTCIVAPVGRTLLFCLFYLLKISCLMDYL